MLITLSPRPAICQSDAEILLTSVFPLRAISHKFNFLSRNIIPLYYYMRVEHTTEGTTNELAACIRI